MSKSQKVAILGLGAVGAFFAERFLATDHIETCVVADDERYERLKRVGILINGRPLIPPLIRPDEKTSPADLVIVTLKHQHLDAALPDLRNLVGEETTIVSFMNGLDSEAMIGEVYGAEKVLYGISVGIDSVRENNDIRFCNPGRHIFGAADNSQHSKRVTQVAELFTRAEIPHEIPTDMIRTLWWKFMINVGMNQASAVMRAPYGVFQTFIEAQELMKALMLEVITLAQAAGIDLSLKDLDNWYPVLHSLSPDGKTSMLQDVEAGRKTELDIFGGKVLELGKTYKVATPINWTIVQLIKVLEQSGA
ncbi:MAG: ketopantoate reductase family protein [Desulfuromonadales bacterium]|nr:ketopantoate reductase family protein [Desulfuromonadales bacterium]MBN2791862.1 ketopantoate reductase family protein [Desulfuromonadales bacterium]